jgi:hypothetical protein
MKCEIPLSSLVSYLLPERKSINSVIDLEVGTGIVRHLRFSGREDSVCSNVFVFIKRLYTLGELNKKRERFKLYTGVAPFTASIIFEP